MRVTNKMLSNNFLRDMNVNLQNMSKLQQQMSSGKEISKPSDDPFKVARAMQLQTDINTNKQYNVNIQSAANTLDVTDTALGQAGNVMKRVNELLISAGNAGYGPDEKKAIKDEINQKISEFSQIMDTNFDGKYIFGGSRGTTKPMDTVVDPTTKNTRLIYFKSGGELITATDAANALAASVTAAATATATATAADIAKATAAALVASAAATAAGVDAKDCNQIGSKINVEISQGVTIDYNVSASEMIQFPQTGSNISGDLRNLFSNIVNHLDGNNDAGTATDTGATLKLTTTDLQGIKDAMDNLLSLRAEVGAKTNRMDSAKTNNEDETYNMTAILSTTEDIDITQKTMEYYTMQTVYTASLQTSAKVIQPSLLDYLR